VPPPASHPRRFLRRQRREDQWVELGPDPDARYDEEVHVDLAALEPLIARPHQPDNVVPVEQVAGTPVFQVCFGSSVNSWYEDLAIPAAVMRGKHLPPHTAGTISPGSRQILTTITTSGVLEDLERAGLRILEPACGPCVGIGQAPPTGKASVRTFNRNFKGRSGTVDDQVYLASPATTAATGLAGVITDPRGLGDFPEVDDPDPVVDDFMLLAPPPAEHLGAFRGLFPEDDLPWDRGGQWLWDYIFVRAQVEEYGGDRAGALGGRRPGRDDLARNRL